MSKKNVLGILALVLPLAMTAQSITLSNTGNLNIDGIYTVSDQVNSYPIYTKKATGTTYKISPFQVKNPNKTNIVAGWIISDNQGREYFAINTTLNQPPSPPADGWDVARAGVGLNPRFSISYSIPFEKTKESFTLSFTNTEKTNVSIFPNPTTGIVNLFSTSPIKKITLTNLDGKVLLTGVNQKLDVSALPAGVYLLTLETNKEQVQRRIVKE